MTHRLRQRLARPGPKRLLALDGGGIRGLITLGYLERIEAELRARHRRSDLVLSDYFDLVGGTSTGSIIAALLALGRSVSEVRDLYLRLGSDAFQEKRSWLGSLGRILGAKFDEQPLEALLRDALGAERTLSSPDFACGLMVVAKRFDTGSVWPLVNLPDHVYAEHNKDMKLWEVVRSSTAAPTFFRPKSVDDVGEGERAVFVDGAISMHNNPALLLLQVATLRGFGLGWPVGADRLLVCSVGTGAFLRLASQRDLQRDSNLHMVPHIVTQLLRDSSEFNETMLQWMSRSPTARVIDSQIGALDDDLLAPEPLLSYLRYDLDLDVAGLAALGLRLSPAEIERLQDMSDTQNIAQLDNIGRAAADGVRSEHFPVAFDLVSGRRAESGGGGRPGSDARRDA